MLGAFAACEIKVKANCNAWVEANSVEKSSRMVLCCCGSIVKTQPSLRISCPGLNDAHREALKSGFPQNAVSEVRPERQPTNPLASRDVGWQPGLPYLTDFETVPDTSHSQRKRHAADDCNEFFGRQMFGRNATSG
ncbi:hypothetical protein V8J82_21785 [Gymnodinialimonas sp. 2305UL16-5]|uniref:hypothetical protein n=1 Tax=Gymnodinialimonas mytili TaxID=3126503 RepID=UPI0030B702DC